MINLFKSGARARQGRGLSRRALMLTAGAISMVACAPVGAAALSGVAAHAFDDFFHEDQVRNVVLSPDGQRIAILREIKQGERRNSLIDIIGADDPGGDPLRVQLGDIQAEAMEWGSSQRLLVRIRMEREFKQAAAIGSIMEGDDYKIVSRRVISINAGTGHTVAMFGGERQRMRHSSNLGQVVAVLPDEHILMAAADRDGILALYRVNIVDGRAVLVERGGGATIGWHAQNGVAVLRRDINVRGDVETWYGRAPGEQAWRFVRRTRIYDAPDFAWVGETDRTGVVHVQARLEGEDVVSVRELDLATLSFGPPIHSRPGRDVIIGLNDHNLRYLGAAFWGDRLQYDFVDPALGAHHRAMNRFFEDEANVRLIDVSADRDRFLAYVDGPREAGAWYFYDRTARSFVNIASRTRLDPARLSSVRLVKVPTRDGQEIEAWLTVPPGGRRGRWSLWYMAGPRCGTPMASTTRPRCWRPGDGGWFNRTSGVQAATAWVSPRPAGGAGATGCRRTSRTRSTGSSSKTVWTGTVSPSSGRATAAMRP